MTGLAAGSTATILTLGLRALSTSPTPVIVPPVPTPDTKISTCAVRVAPDLLGRGLAMDFRVGRVLELLRHEVVRVLGHQLLGLAHGAGHAFGGRRQDHLGAQGLQQPPPLERSCSRAW